jgi:hypothetical protein
MGSVGDAYDNAMCESFFATLECELLDRHRFKTQAEARLALFSFIEGFYNPRRRHSSIGYLSPIEYELVWRPIPTHTSLPSCSRPSRTSPSGGPQVGPSLTAAARDGRTIVRAGMEEWLRQGPNKRMTPRSRRVKYHQTRYPDPKPSTVHQIGASPVRHHPRRQRYCLY